MSEPAIEVLAENPSLLIVSKPPGITVIPARSEPPDVCLQRRIERVRGARLWIVHRIDRDTSGIVVFARDASAHRRMSIAFEHHRIAKTYRAWVVGDLKEDSARIDAPLHLARKGHTRLALPGEAGALASHTRFRVLSRTSTALGTVADLVVEPLTGRQHQIRTHLRSIDAPLVVDPIYARRPTLLAGRLGDDSPAVSRLTLHSWKMVIPADAAGGLAVEVEAPLPEDLARLDAWLGAHR